jgi:hypothetical protein
MAPRNLSDDLRPELLHHPRLLATGSVEPGLVLDKLVTY